MRRTDLMDTSERVHKEMVRRLRELTPAKRLAMMFDRAEAGRQMHRLALLRVAERKKEWASRKSS